MGIPNSMTPARPDWDRHGASITYTRLDTAPEDPDPPLFMLTVDTPSARTVTFWQAEELEKVLRRGLDMLGVLPDGLVLATPDDLRDLGK